MISTDKLNRLISPITQGSSPLLFMPFGSSGPVVFVGIDVELGIGVAVELSAGIDVELRVGVEVVNCLGTFSLLNIEASRIANPFGGVIGGAASSRASTSPFGPSELRSSTPPVDSKNVNIRHLRGVIIFSFIFWPAFYLL